ncbi:protein transport protein Bos1p [Trichomonascus vanleenenianus]|uniref:Bos1p n=1 Tax=Trichomonascus vanleenenianus TaxID=2268995 RepID=UPI003ECA5681
MNSLYNHALKQSQALRRDLDSFAADPEQAPLSLQGQISATVTALTRTVEDYSRAASNEMVDEKKQKAQVRIEQLRNEIHEAKEELARLKRQREESVLQTSRQELFARQRHPGSGGGAATPDAASLENPYGYRPPSTREEGLAREHNTLSRAGDQIDDFIERGRAVLGDLGSQSDMLRRTHRSIVSTATTLGISADTIRMVERRAMQDKWIFYGGIIIMLVCFYYIIKWFG